LRSGEVIQRTRRAERAWNWVGAVVHWINPTLLRKHQSVWRWTVWSAALLGILLTLAGMWLGVVRYVDLKRWRRPGVSPFTGWLRWHHSIGLFAAAFVLTWIFSGWLTVDRGALFSRDEPTVLQVERLRGVSLADAAGNFPVLQLRKLGNPREIEVTAVGGHPFLIVRDAGVFSSELISTDDTGALRAMTQRPAHADVQTDEARFIDRTTMGVIITEDHVTKDGELPREPVKSVALIARKPGLSVEDFQRHWLEVHGPIADGLPGLRRYVQSHTRRSAYEAGRVPAYDGAVLMWFDSTDVMRGAEATPQYARVLADAATFLDVDRVRSILTREHVIVA